jgi:hypothetical protein
MNNDEQFGGTGDLRGGAAGSNTPHAELASWLLHALRGGLSPESAGATTRADSSIESSAETSLKLLLDSDYHPRFYQQLPDFVMALLSNDPRATLNYAPLLYHLAGCRACHQGYLELYDAMHAAIHPRRPRLVLGQGTRTLAATPQRMLGHLCQALISQAEALQRAARRSHSDEDATARALLQVAIRIGAHIGQSSIRRQALRDLVSVATLFDGPTPPAEYDPAAYVYTPLLTGAGMRSHRKIVRHADLVTRSAGQEHQEQAEIRLQSHALEGSIFQQGSRVLLHLRDLDKRLHGRYVTISVPLGSLFEPVLWLGGNPRAIRSQSPVDATGQLLTLLGETDLRLSNPEDHNLLEVIFMLLEVHPTS